MPETLQEDAPPPASGPVEAVDPPFALQLVVWIGVFSAIAWGMMVLFRDRSQPPGAT